MVDDKNPPRFPGLSRPPLVFVAWLDCTSLDAWLLPSEVEEHGCPIIETVGWLTVENKDVISVSVAREVSFGKVAGTFTIPRSQIIEWYEFEIKGM